MKLLHSADWHLGARLHGIERAGEAGAALDALVAVAREEAVDAVLVAGDLLDRRLVDSAALGRCLSALERLAEVAPVIAVAGNHDDPDLWNHLAPHLTRSGIHVAGRLRAAAETVVSVETAAGPLHAALVPWPEPARLALEAGASVQEARARYADLVGDFLADAAAEATRRRAEEGGRAVMVGHLMVERARAGGGEREMTMGIAYAVSAARLPRDLDYIALGHVHRAQAIPGLTAPGRYAGSPIALDFGDDRQETGACLVEIAGDTTQAREVPLPGGRPLVTLRGPLERLEELAAEHPGAWFACEVELDGPVMDLVRSVRERVPDALRVEPRYAAGAGAEAEDPAEGNEAVTALPDLYEAWHARVDRPLTPARAAAFARALAAARPADEEDG